METKKETTKVIVKKENVAPKKRISKAMLAAKKYSGCVEILDMDALFKPVC